MTSAEGLLVFRLTFDHPNGKVYDREFHISPELVDMGIEAFSGLVGKELGHIVQLYYEWVADGEPV